MCTNYICMKGSLYSEFVYSVFILMLFYDGFYNAEFMERGWWELEFGSFFIECIAITVFM